MHEGHRQRMYEKLNSGCNMPDHELLEILLYSAVSRKNTNGLAHRLLAAFGSLNGVLGASTAELKTIDGVGDGVANFLHCVNECMQRAYGQPKGIVNIKNYGDLKNFVIMRMRGKQEETLEIYFITKSGKIKSIFSFTSEELHKINISPTLIQERIVVAKPHGIVIAHNHIECASQNAAPFPSLDDDKFTKAIQLMCSLSGTVLYDHCIYANGEVYSYDASGKFLNIKNYTYDKLMKIADNSLLPISEKYVKAGN